MVCWVQGHCCFVDIAGLRIMTTEGLSAVLANTTHGGAASPQLHASDHILVPAAADVDAMNAKSRDGSVTVAVLYGALGTQCFQQFHQHLLAAAERGGWSTFMLPFSSCATTLLTF